EPLAERGVGLGAKDLDRDLAVEPLVPRAPYLGGPAAIDALDETVPLAEEAPAKVGAAGRRGHGLIGGNSGAAAVPGQVAPTSRERDERREGILVDRIAPRDGQLLAQQLADARPAQRHQPLRDDPARS